MSERPMEAWERALRELSDLELCAIEGALVAEIDAERAVLEAERRAACGARWCVPATVRAVLPLARALYASPEGGAGCCLHVVLDDGNVEHAHVSFCLGQASQRGHDACERLARQLLGMTRGQRWRLYEVNSRTADARWKGRAWP